MTFEAARPTTKHESKYREDSQTESRERGLVNQIWSSPGHFDQNFGRSQSDLPNQSQQSAAEKHILGNFEIGGVSTAGDQSSSAIASDANNHSEIQSVKPAGEQMSTFTPGENLDQTIKYLQDSSNRHDVDYSRSFENGVRVVGLGDAWHVSMGSKDEFVSHLKELKGAGATHVGFELLPQSLESSVNRYYDLRDKAPDSDETKSARNELKRHFDSIWKICTTIKWLTCLTRFTTLDSSRSVSNLIFPACTSIVKTCLSRMVLVY